MTAKKSRKNGLCVAPTIDEIVAAHGRRPVTDPETLYGDFWPRDETTDDFLAALRKWRLEE